MVRALGSRNYRLFFAGQLISLIGTWLTTVATAWLVYSLTRDTLTLGTVTFCGQIPAFLLAPLAGVLVDRWSLHRTLVVTQTLSMLESTALALLTFGHLINVPWIFALNVFQGLVNAFDMPARQAFVVQMVENREDLPNAIALNSSMFNAARLLGPSIAGILIALVGEGLCFTLDALSYVAVIVALLRMIVPPPAPRKAPRHPLVEFREGLEHALGFTPIRAILLILALVSLMGTPYTVLMPAFTDKTLLGGGPGTLGMLMAATGLGALLGAIVLAARRSVLGLGRLIPMATVGFGITLIAFSFSRHLSLSLALLAGTGFCMITQMAAGNTLLQTIVDDDKRGRIMSLFGMSFLGMMPLGSLLMGYLAKPQHLGPPKAVALGGVCCIVGAGIFASQLPRIRREIRPIYVRRGILPDVAQGLAQAAELSVPPER